VLTADHLDAWLEKAPQVSLWLSERINNRVHGARSLESWWREWTDLSDPYPISAQLVLAGRAKQGDQIKEWLAGDPDKHTFQADSVDEGVAFIAAALLPTDPDRDARFARVLVVDDKDMWREIITVPQPLILIPTFSEPWAKEAIRKGHHVLIPVNPDEPAVAEMELPQIPIDEARAALTEMAVPGERAEQLAREARGGLLPLRRSLAGGSFRRPAWAASEPAQHLVSALLAISWDAGQSGDRDVLAQLAGRAYDELTVEFDRWANAADPPLRRRGSVWVLSAKRDAWNQLHPYITPRHWDLFAKTAIATLGAADPAWELPAEERWLAGIKGKQRPHSDRLRRGIAEALAIIASEPGLANPAGGGQGPSLAEGVVRTLLDQASEEPSVVGWASLGDLLPLLAEAGPDAFLNAVSRAASGDAPVLASLMGDEGDGSLFGSRAYHSGLLWALETLAWSPDHLGRVAGLLARLSAIDPGGRWANRPANSFVEIFAPIHPQNTATVEQRVRILRAVRRDEPDAAWSLFVQLLDRSGVISAIAKPRWRPWPTLSFDSTTTWGDWLETVGPIVEWLAEDAGADGRRWAEVVRILPDLPRGDVVDPLAERLLRALETLRPAELDSAGRLELLARLRDTVGAHRTHAEQPWAMPAERVERLAAVMNALEPDDPVESKGWLFAYHPDLDIYVGSDYHRYDEVWLQLVQEAAAEVLDRLGWDGIERLVAVAANPYMVGWALGQREDVGTDQLRHWFESGEDRLRQAADGFVRSRVRREGLEWLEGFARTSVADWSTNSIGRALAVGAPRAEGWTLAENLGPDVESVYWQRFDGLALGDDAWAAAPLLRKHGRPYYAVEVMAHALKDKGGAFDADEVYGALLAASQTEPGMEFNRGMFQLYLVRLLGRLEDVGFDPAKIAQLEWLFLPLLERGDRRPKLLLHSELATNPEFFVTVISALYRAKGEAADEADERTASVARQAFQLLSTWRDPPGVVAGQFDEGAVKYWITEARRRLMEANRLEVGDSQIGQVLWFLPPGPDGFKPPEAVRNLLEELRSEQLEAGFATGALNSRGVTTRSPTSGGQQEHELADTYRSIANSLAGEWDRTSRIYRKLAESYDGMAERFDHEAQLTADEY
jgi:hypothetical protein